MHWLQVTEDSTPLFVASDCDIPGDDVQQSSQLESFFNRFDDIYKATPLRFCLPHQVRCMLDIKLTFMIRKCSLTLGTLSKVSKSCCSALLILTYLRTYRPIQGGPKKLHTAFFAITLPTLNQFA